MSRKEQKDRTRAAIIAAAFEVMAGQGLLAARTLDIAEAAGVAHGTVFAHFPTREDLLCAVIEELGQRVACRLHVLAADGHGIRAALEAHLQGLQEFEPLYVRLVAEGRELPAKVRSVFLMIQSAISLHIGEAVEEETRRGIVRSMPLHLLFNTWIGLVHHYLMNGDFFAPGAPSVMRKTASLLVEHFYDLLKQ
jgi:AcrR family transcriptional regulator